jgi:hypothetical protein
MPMFLNAMLLQIAIPFYYSGVGLIDYNLYLKLAHRLLID